MADSIPGSACLTSLATLTVFAFGAFVICSPMVCLPLVLVMVSAGTETTCTVPSWPMVAGALRAVVAPETDEEPAAAAAAEDVEAEPEPPAAAGDEVAEPAALEDGAPPAGMTVRFEIWSRLVSEPET